LVKEFIEQAKDLLEDWLGCLVIAEWPNIIDEVNM